MESKSPNLIAIGAVVAIILGLAMTVAGPGSRLDNAYSFLTNTTPAQSGQPIANAGAHDYHLIARQDAIDNHIDGDLFVTQIQVESGFNPDAVSPMGAIGIAQIMPSTAAGWNVDPHDPVASLSAAAKAMAWYSQQYSGDYTKALSAYNYGYVRTNTAISNCGANWRACVPAETDRYIRAITGA